MTGHSTLARSQLFTSLIVSLVICCLTGWLAYSGGLNRVGLLFYDFHLRLKQDNQLSKSVVLVQMDYPSSQELGRDKGGWSRAHLSRALDNLCTAGAEVVGLDLILDLAHPDGTVDKQLTEAMDRCNNVVLARVVADADGGERLPLESFGDVMIGDGFINFVPDEDGVLRKLRFFSSKTLDDGGLELLPSFSLELVRTFLNIEYTLDFFSDDHFRLGPEDGDHLILPNPELLINYQGDQSVFVGLSYADVVLGRFDPLQVKGKLVIIGTSLDSDKDRFTTPISKVRHDPKDYGEKFGHIVKGTLGAKEFGVTCHAHGIETILSNQFITPLDPLIRIGLFAAVVIFGLLFYHHSIPMVAEGIAFLGVVITVFIASHLLLTRQLVWLDYSPLLLVLLLQFIAGVMVQKVFNKRRSDLVTSIFGKYVSKDVVSELVAGNIDLSMEGRREELTILFSDLRSFTTIAERLGPAKTSHLLNRYFGAMIPLVFRYGGTLDKLIGDAVMAIYGAPLPLENHEEKAAHTALSMVEALAEMNETAETDDNTQLKMGIGINTGMVTVGNLGSPDHVEYTVIGDAVNLASRLEGLTKVYGVNILVTESTAAGLQDRFCLRELDLVRVKGKLEPIRLYELCGPVDSVNGDEEQVTTLFDQGLSAYRRRDWQQAEKLFLKINKITEGYAPAELYLNRIKQLRRNPPADDWSGVTVFTE
ncbi:MAG: adenylate/guanylate cyclase domain-containing protein, partial [Thermodesulfobacteriota bacterium]